ncbi:uncharacterized protein [Nicotiana tomentosiformis]|uniref:uncharacterized protein isoform X1 n=1 Tax=Nicotiana tomentosiformis TaxID=4098 RepID=UPI00051B341C|nr:uncharacterized protein LOC104103583 isoform X1 [Nicotiana tomentosiformis]
MKLKNSRTLVVALFFLQLLRISNGISTSQLLQQISSQNNKYLTKEEHWFNQSLDHFSPYDHRTFGQRYYEFLDYFRIPDGPIFLKICGESACNGIPNDYLSDSLSLSCPFPSFSPLPNFHGWVTWRQGLEKEMEKKSIFRSCDLGSVTSGSI